MSRSSDEDAFAGCIVVLIYLIFRAIVAGFCWTYAVNQVLVLTDKEASMYFWQGMIIGFVPLFGQARVSIGLAFITWLVMMFLI